MCFSLAQYFNSLCPNDLSIMNYNISSFSRNFDNFFSAFNYSEMPSILVLTETWFSPGQTSEIPGYHGYHTVREGRSGGVSIFVKNYIESRHLPEFSYASITIEICSIEIKINKQVFVIIGIYRPHSDSVLLMVSSIRSMTYIALHFL